MKRLTGTIALLLLLCSILTIPTFANTSEHNKSTELHVQLRLKTDQQEVAYIPEIELGLYHGNKANNLLATAIANKSNYDVKTNTYNIIFNVPEYTIGDSFKLTYQKGDNLVKNLKFYDNITVEVAGSQEVPEYSINEGYYLLKQSQHAPVEIVLDYGYDAEGNEYTVLKGTKEAPFTVDVLTDNSKVLVMLEDVNGNPVRKESVKVRSVAGGEVIEVTSNDRGIIALDASKVRPGFNIISNSQNYNIVGDMQYISFPRLTLDNPELQGMLSYKVKLEKVVLSGANESSVTVNFSTNHNLDLSKSWTVTDLTLSKIEGNETAETVVTVSSTNNKIFLEDGNYQIASATSRYSDVTLKSNTVTVVDGKAEINLTLEPKHTLSIANGNDKYKFSILNVPELKDRVYIGKNSMEFAVTPGEAYVIQDLDTDKIFNVSIEPNSKVTKVYLNRRADFDPSMTPHTGDDLYIILGFVVLSLTGAIFTWVKYNKHKKLINASKNSMLSILLVTALITSIFTAFPPVEVYADTEGSQGSHYGGKKNTTGNWQVSPGKGRSVLQFGFVPIKDAINLTNEATKDELANKFKFRFQDAAFYMAPDELSNERLSSTSVYRFDEGELKERSQNYIVPKSSESKNSNNVLLKLIATAIDDKDLSNNAFGESLNTVFDGYKGLENQGKRDELFRGFIALLKDFDTNPAIIDYYEKMYKDNQLVLFVQTMVYVYINGVPNSGNEKFISAHDLTAIDEYVRTDNITPSQAYYERDYIKGKRGTGANTTNPRALKFGNITYSAAPYLDNNYLKTLRPKNKNVGGSTNPFGGWGFLHLEYNKDAVNDDIANNPKLSVDMYITVVDQEGNPTGETFTVPVQGWEEKDNREFVNITMDYNINNKIVKGPMTITHNNNVYRIKPNPNTVVDFFDISDGEALNKSPLTRSGVAEALRISAPFISDTNNWRLILDVDTKPLTEDLHVYLGGSLDDEGTADSEYDEWLRSFLGEEITKQENKYVGQLDAEGKPKSSNAKAVVHVEVVDNKTLEIDNETYEVAQWRLSKYWSNITENYKQIATFSISLSSDDWNSHAGSGLSPSGVVNFRLVNPDLSSSPWFFSRAKFLGGTGASSITRSNNSASFYVGGDLLAVKHNDSVDNIRFASWVNYISLNGVGSTSKGNNNSKAKVEKELVFKYGIENPYHYTNYIAVYSHTTDEDGKDVCECYTTSETPSKYYTTADYKKKVAFNRYLPKTIVNNPTFKPSSQEGNGFYWEAIDTNIKLNVNPEVLMAYDDVAGRTSVGFVAGDYLRQVQVTAYNKIQYNVDVKPTVVGTTIATDGNAKQLAQRLNASSKSVLYKGSQVNVSYEITGDITAKSFTLDIDSSALKYNWNPGNTYTSDKVNDDFMSRFATKTESNLWSASLTEQGSLKVNNNKYDGNSKVSQMTAETVVENHSLVVRGGKLITVNGIPVENVTGELKEALEKMGLLGDNSILSAFERGSGANLTEQDVATLGNAIRGTTDLALDRPWYNEDTTILVVREYTHVFKLPQAHMYTDRLPLNIPGLETPQNKLQFFSKGFTGHTMLRLSLPVGNYVFDSTGKSTEFIVPNVSVMDILN